MSTQLIRAHLPNFSFFLFLAQVAAAKHELKVAQKAAVGGSSKGHARVERPDKLRNLQAAMGLSDDHETYHDFCVSFLFSFLAKPN